MRVLEKITPLAWQAFLVGFALAAIVIPMVIAPANAQGFIDLDGDGEPETPLLPALPPGFDEVPYSPPPFIPGNPALDENLRAAVIEQLEFREGVACSANVTVRPRMKDLLGVFNPFEIGLPFQDSCVGKTKLLDNDPLSVGFQPGRFTANRLDGDEMRLFWRWRLLADAEDTGNALIDEYANDDITVFPVYIILVGTPRLGFALQWLVADTCDPRLEPGRDCSAMDLDTGRLHPHAINVAGEFFIESW